MSQVCKIVKKADNTDTDGIGYASFSQINFERFLTNSNKKKDYFYI